MNYNFVSARLRALEFETDELAYPPAVTRVNANVDEEEVTPAVYSAGIHNILEAWDEMVDPSVMEKKGELRERYYVIMKRAGHESIPNFSLRYRTLIGEMKSEGIVVDAAE